MPTCTALMRIDGYIGRCTAVRMGRCTGAVNRSATYLSGESGIRGFTLTELIVVVLVVSLFVLLAMVNFSGLLARSTFRAQAHELVSTMQSAVSAAAESGRRYGVIINIDEQSYTLREITSPELYGVPEEEEIIITNQLGQECRISYIQFDDWTGTDEDIFRVHFIAGPSGWQYGGKIVLLDKNEEPYSVVVNRINRVVTLVEGDVELLPPRTKDEVLF
jgi:prepilin-type N-terminal cleavage/methylation domain-containing protein